MVSLVKCIGNRIVRACYTWYFETFSDEAFYTKNCLQTGTTVKLPPSWNGCLQNLASKPAANVLVT